MNTHFSLHDVSDVEIKQGSAKPYRWFEIILRDSNGNRMDFLIHPGDNHYDDVCRGLGLVAPSDPLTAAVADALTDDEDDDEMPVVVAEEREDGQFYNVRSDLRAGSLEQAYQVMHQFLRNRSAHLVGPIKVNRTGDYDADGNEVFGYIAKIARTSLAGAAI